MLVAENLTKQFDSKLAVNQISFTVKSGVVTGLLGPNGAGKTTTMRLLTGYLEPSSGKVLYNGNSINENPVFLKQRLGYLPESAPLYPDMLVIEFLEYMGSVRGIKENLKEKVEKMIELCDLKTHLNVPISFLSKGFKQRVALAGTLIHDPEIIILDEPTSGLDPNQISHIRSLIKGLAKEKILILSTHILQEVEDICDEVIIINNGQIVANSTVKNLNTANEVLISTNASEKQVQEIFSSHDFLGVSLQNPKDIDGYFSFIISLKENKPELVFERMAKSSFLVREIRSYKKSLESIFEELTRK